MIREFTLSSNSDRELNRKVKLENGHWELFQDECLVKTLNVYEAEYIKDAIKACEKEHARLTALMLIEILKDEEKNV
jgi:bacterioferritin (cytochrome b1)